MGPTSPAEFDALTRLDFEVFVERTFATVKPGATFNDNFHLGVMAHKLDLARRGEIKRLIINVPPRSLKSIAASIALPAFALGHDPTKAVTAISYGQDLADTLARDCRKVMQQAWYQRLFPGTRLSAERQAVNDFHTTAGGKRFATSVGGVMTGLGGDLIIIDDPMKPDEARSDTERKKVNDWYSNTLVTRLDEKLIGSIVVVMQRLHEDDFVGHIMELGDWEVLSFPAIAQCDETHVITTSMGRYTHRRAEGEALDPKREPLHVLADLRRSLGAEYFAAQYLQMPAPPGGGLIKIGQFKPYDEAPEKFDRFVQSWDTASSINDRSDFSVCTTWGIKGQEYYLLNVLRKQMQYPELKIAVKAQSELYPNSTILIEEKGSGIALIQELRRENLTVTPFMPKGDKMFRMEGHTALIENGRVRIPREAHWREAFLHELMMFPNGRYDDQVDSVSQALEYMRFSKNADWDEFFRGLKAGGRKEPDVPSIRIAHSDPGITLGVITGRPLQREADGAFLLTKEEWVPSLIGAGFYLVP